jgi:hypothetical protein
MTISNDISGNKVFEEILAKTTVYLKEESEKELELFLKLEPVPFEIKVLEALEISAKGTIFENSFTHISGQRFPDIISENYGYGVEVKKTISNWQTIGNSIMEGNRVDGIKKVYLFFGKLKEPIEFKYRLYEDCLVGVKISHNPRYSIDMGALEDETIFSKVGHSYDKIRNSKHPFKPIKNYLRRILRVRGEEVWWVDENEESGGDVYVKLWENFSSNERNLFRCRMMGLFPEIFGNKQNKYGRATSWLAATHGIASHALRDTFSSGSRVNLIVNSKKYPSVSGIFSRLQKNVSMIKTEIESFSEEEIENYWDDYLGESDRFEYWTKKVVEQSELFLNAHNMELPVGKLIKEKI